MLFFYNSPQIVYSPFLLISEEVLASYLTSYVTEDSLVTTSLSLPLAQSIITGNKLNSLQRISISFLGFSFFLMHIWFYLLTSDTDKCIPCLLEDCVAQWPTIVWPTALCFSFLFQDRYYLAFSFKIPIQYHIEKPQVHAFSSQMSYI